MTPAIHKPKFDWQRLGTKTMYCGIWSSRNLQKQCIKSLSPIEWTGVTCKKCLRSKLPAKVYK